jgi:hypothetical protein
MQTPELIRAYSTTGPGLVFRLRLASPNEALGHRLQHGPGPRIDTNGRPDRPGRSRA